MILLSEKKFVFDYCIHNRRYIEDIWIQKCLLAWIFANVFEITKNLQTQMTNDKFPLYSMW